MPANAELAKMFARMADVTQLLGENMFKAIAFAKVARILEDLNYDVVEAARAGELPEIPGVGDHSRRIIEQYSNKGTSEDYDQLIKDVPVGVLDMLKIPGLGPKTAAVLWKKCKIESVQELELAITEGSLTKVKGLGDRKLTAMLDGIKLLKAGLARRGILDVVPIVNRLCESLAKDKRVGDVQAAGSFRRRRETLGDLDLICWVHKMADALAVVEAFCSQSGVERVLASGGTKGSILVNGGFQVDLRIVPKSSFGSANMYFTGSKEHNIRLRGLAQDKGFTLSEWGLYKIEEYDKAARKSGEAPDLKSVAGVTEESVYHTLGLAFVEPELREDRGEIEAAASGTLPKLVDARDIRGDLHLHTTASDGVNTIEEMVHGAKALGYQYIAITDHSRSSVIANGLDEQRLREHIRAIRAVHVPGITVLAGSEVDIHPDGTLDYDPGLLAELDIVVASPHASLKQDAAKATDRLLRAIETKYVNIIGHPTGRMINQREGLPLDIAKVIKAAAKTGTALEINAGWPRWDLNDVNARRAADAGVVIAINTDAHAVPGYRDMAQGLWVARRAWLTPAKILNCWPLEQLKAFLAQAMTGQHTGRDRWGLA